MKVSLVIHNIRSTHNVGAFFRTCDGLGVDKIIFSGYTPYPTFEGDTRLPHFADKLTRQIHKTALGAESFIDFTVYDNLETALDTLKAQNTVLVALEQSKSSVTLEKCKNILKNQYSNCDVALIVGNEIHGVMPEILKQVGIIVEIPMQGKKESLNVSIATAIALYELTK